MPARLTAPGTLAAALLIAAPAHADLIGHECSARQSIDGGEVSASVFMPMQGAAEYPELRWATAERKTEHGHARLYVDFRQPPAGASPTLPAKAFLDAFVMATPVGQADVILTAGGVSVRQPFYRPADFPPSPAAGVVAQMTIRDPAFISALTAAPSLHMVLRQSDGVVLDETDLDLTARPAALDALAAAWRGVLAQLPDARTRCETVSLDE